jgi:uncharacterized protein YrrD
MERNYKKVIGTPILTDHSRRPATTVKDLLIDPETGKIVAFIVDRSKDLVVLPMDVLEWKNVIHINDHDAIVEAEDLVRVVTLMNKHIQISGQPVETKAGDSLGKVQDFSVDDRSLSLKNLYVYKGWMGLLRYDGVIISAKDIVEILPDKIVVMDKIETVKEEEGDMALEDAMAG